MWLDRGAGESFGGAGEIFGDIELFMLDLLDTSSPYLSTKGSVPLDRKVELIKLTP